MWPRVDVADPPNTFEKSTARAREVFLINSWVPKMGVRQSPSNGSARSPSQIVKHGRGLFETFCKSLHVGSEHQMWLEVVTNAGEANNHFVRECR